MSLIRNVASPEGEEVGKEIFRLFAEPAFKRFQDIAEDRCSTCAFRPGTLAAGSAGTQMTVMKCILERRDFCCHEKHRDGKLCAGFQAISLMQLRDGVKVIKAPWDFPEGADHPMPSPTHNHE